MFRRRLLVSHDLKKIAPYLDPEVTGVMVTGESIRGPEEMDRYWNRIREMLGESGRYTVKLNHDKTDLIGEMAVPRGTTDELIRLSGG